MRIAIKFAYNGINYHGFARQPNVSTIEEKIIESLYNTKTVTDHRIIHIGRTKFDKY